MLLVEIFDNLYQRLASARQLSQEVSIHVCMTFRFFHVLVYWLIFKFLGCK